MKIKILPMFVLSCLMALLPSGLQAQEKGKYAHNVGAAAGFTTGYGLSYRYMPGKNGIQLTFAPYHDNQLDRYSVGLTLLHHLIQGEVSNFFLYQGTHYFYNSRLNEVYNPIDNSYSTQRFTESYVNVGLGIGLEVLIAKRIGLNLMTGYAAYDNFRKYNLTAEAGLYYKF